MNVALTARRPPCTEALNREASRPHQAPRRSCQCGNSRRAALRLSMDARGTVFPTQQTNGFHSIIFSQPMRVDIQLGRGYEFLWGGNEQLGMVNAGAVVSWPLHADSWAEPAPPGLIDLSTTPCGPYNSVALRGDGTVAGWNEPAAIPPDGLTDVVSPAAGQEFTVALKHDGTAIIWADPPSPYYNTNPSLWPAQPQSCRCWRLPCAGPEL